MIKMCCIAFIIKVMNLLWGAVVVVMVYSWLIKKMDTKWHI